MVATPPEPEFEPLFLRPRRRDLLAMIDTCAAAGSPVVGWTAKLFPVTGASVVAHPRTLMWLRLGTTGLAGPLDVPALGWVRDSSPTVGTMMKPARSQVKLPSGPGGEKPVNRRS